MTRLKDHPMLPPRTASFSLLRSRDRSSSAGEMTDGLSCVPTETGDIAGARGACSSDALPLAPGTTTGSGRVGVDGDCSMRMASSTELASTCSTVSFKTATRVHRRYRVY